MAYEPYASESYYANTYGGEVLEDNAKKFLIQASRHIDSLTYNRIVSKGFSNLTDFQKAIIKDVCCIQAEFEFENEDVLETVLSGYSINGVSAQFRSSWNVYTDHGVAMKRDVYAMLCQTGQ